MDQCIEHIQQLSSAIKQKVSGQDDVIDHILLAMIANGHILLEGMPGTAKTRTVKVLAEVLEVSLGRIQFTPDLLPSDVIGYDTLDTETGSTRFSQGPVFNDIILADEINRSPPKVQSALLEAMEERQVTVGSVTHDLSQLFMVLGTQNPIEQEGTYPLPEAQLDRFLMKVTLDFPDEAGELNIIRLVRSEESPQDASLPTIDPVAILEARKRLTQIYVSEAVEKYMVGLTHTTRHPETREKSTLAGWLRVGVSPRATIALDRCARAQALMDGRDHVTPDDVRRVLPSILSHRLILGYRAAADGVDARGVVDEILRLTPVE